ncbi:MAG: FAD-binding oxidoreductase [Chloroflexi bacterium]|nr:FAD-binding oxidoreductase [Chloroflexota bacterium]
MSFGEQRTYFDIIIIGSGSVGSPTAYFLADAGLDVLVIDRLPSAGQYSNKHAIGGIRATHSDLAKINLSKRSLEVFSTWQERHGDDIEWHQGGYSFVAYNEETARLLKDLVPWQQEQNLNISWLHHDELIKLIPHLNPSDLLGGTYSPGDGSASPLRAAFAFHKRAVQAGACFHFNETVKDFLTKGDRVTGVKTNCGEYYSQWVINASGGWAKELSANLGLEVQVEPDSHEAAITEPIKRMFHPMVVDMRARPGSENFYFYQHPTGKIIFCMTPDPQILGSHTIASSDFLPKASRRLIELMPVLKHIRVRRAWRGTYPMTPDGSPIIGRVDGLEGFLLAVGMCGQGFMLGPGVGLLLKNLILNELDQADKNILDSLTYHRSFSKEEILK